MKKKDGSNTGYIIAIVILAVLLVAAVAAGLVLLYLGSNGYIWVRYDNAAAAVLAAWAG